nr:hypothetical protein CFP56_04951 [Quercus suber]
MTINEMLMKATQARATPSGSTRAPLTVLSDVSNINTVNAATWKRQVRYSTGTDVIMEDAVGSKRSVHPTGGQPELQKKKKTVSRVGKVKSGYRFLQTEFQNQQPGQSNPLMLKPLWKGIWSLKVPSKVKNLVWRAVKNSLPTKQNLVKRKVLTDDCCDQCKMQKEDTLHALYLCPKLEEIWLSKQAWNQCSLRQVTSFVDLMGYILAENRDPDLFAMVVWAIWKRRNDIRVGKRGENLPNLVQQAQTRLQNFLLHNSAATTSTALQKKKEKKRIFMPKKRFATFGALFLLEVPLNL